MKLAYSLKTAINGLTTHKSRSFLTILGIVIGITAIILVMSIGKGAQELILNQIRGMGTTVIAIEPGRQPNGPSGFLEIFSDSLKPKDMEAIRNPSNVRGLKEISPMVYQSANVSFGNETKRATVVGSSERLAGILNLKISQGNLFTQEEISQKGAVIVLGANIKKDLFGESDAIGKKIKIKNKSFRIIGIFAEKGMVSMFNADDMALIPYTTAQEYILGINHFNELIAEANSEEIVKTTASDITLTLRESHGITDPSKDDFHITTQADAMKTVGSITTILTVLLTSIAAISLVVGGIGIMNIMLVSVLERTREIGLRKALGATEKNILFQFLLESIILTGLGGIIGIILGVTYSFIASFILSKVVAMGWVFTISVNAILLGLGVAISVGLIFGIYPAKKASQKSPVEALRYE